MAKANERAYLPIYSLDESRILLEDGEYRVQPLGLILVHRTEGMGVLRDVMARVKDFFGGNVGTYNNSVYADLILPAMRELSDRAHDIYTSDVYGAPDAILGFSMSVIPVSSKGMSMMQATMYGTAVKLHKVERSVALQPAASPTAPPESRAA